MNQIHEIKVPRVSVNDDFVIVIQWYSKSGDFVRSGDAIVSVETLKTVFDIETEKGGYLEILQKEGSEVPVGKAIARLHGKKIEEKIEINDNNNEKNENDRNVDYEQRISNRAKILIKKHNIDLKVFLGMAFVKEIDVLDYLKGGKHHGGR